MNSAGNEDVSFSLTKVTSVDSCFTGAVDGWRGRRLARVRRDSPTGSASLEFMYIDGRRAVRRLPGSSYGDNGLSLGYAATPRPVGRVSIGRVLMGGDLSVEEGSPVCIGYALFPPGRFALSLLSAPACSISSKGEMGQNLRIPPCAIHPAPL